ncbi:hypothetical protein C8F04DRAFT_1267867 [Mycena alexandri]|uniref:CxC2-like cysteine cluster KDZ transposase-associated domain-containing protein n=1 Tax=Mycena alexandri TaxID=1745969 RepID=A0AAD6WX65_9AGAR|nr:hypothetical protein C8F04DRAFT_1267867 [Mycena alexandri]
MAMRPRVRQKNKNTLAASQDDGLDDYHLSIPLDEFIAPASAAVATLVERTSADGRRTYVQTFPVEPPSPVKRMRLDALRTEDSTPMDDDPPLPDLSAFNGESMTFQDPPPKRPKAKSKITPADKSMHEWRGLRDEFLRELLRLEGCGDVSEDVCPSCNAAQPTIRCCDCFGEELYCVACTVEMHGRNPLHVIEVWDGKTFKRTSLKDLGLRVQMHHDDCVSPVAVDNFVVLDLGHIHEVSVDFCGCEKRHTTGRRTELLRRRWYPATHDTPRTAATFKMLDFFVIQTHQAKTTMYDFYTAMARSTSGSGEKLLYRYPEFLRMVRQWRHLQLLKRAGRGHDPSGVNGTRPGELALECPACPRPNVNLPDDWENASAGDKFLYCLFIALNACFRLKRRMISSELCDPGLGTGWAYFVEQEPYRQYLLAATNENEYVQWACRLGLREHEILAGIQCYRRRNGVCARHEFVQPTGVGDLQKGERYSNMDWVFSAIMRWKHERLPKAILYDIVCQWIRNPFERLIKLPPIVRFSIVTSLMRFVIPKMHIHSHTLACQLIFSLNFLLGAAQTDAEGIERPWANLGGVVTSTREMAPGSCHDTLDSHLSYWNWSKLIGIADLLRRRLDKARIEEKEQSTVFEEFLLEQGERVEGWRAMVHAYESNPKKLNPYEGTTKAKTEADVRLALAEDEAARPSLHDVSPSGFIYAGLDLEDQQRRVCVSIELKKARTAAQKIDIVGMRRKLSRGIMRFRKLQATYMPAALQALARLPADPTETPERLLGRSAIHRGYGAGRPMRCGPHAPQAKIIPATKVRTRNRKYQTAWTTIRVLNGGDASSVGWRKLRQADIRMMEDSEDARKRNERRKEETRRRKERERRLIAEGVEEEDEEEGWEDEDDGNEPGVATTESRRLVSWIWTTTGTTGSDVELEEALRIEWAKARSAAAYSFLSSMRRGGGRREHARYGGGDDDRGPPRTGKETPARQRLSARGGVGTGGDATQEGEMGNNEAREGNDGSAGDNEVHLAEAEDNGAQAVPRVGDDDDSGVESGDESDEDEVYGFASDEVIFAEFQRPARLSTVKLLGRGKVFQIFVVRPDFELFVAALEEMAPLI